MLFLFTFLVLYTAHSVQHRISTTRMEMAGSRLVFSLIEPNWPLPYSTVPVLGLRDARPAGWVTFFSICASTMPRAQNRAAKGSIILWRRLTLPIWVYNLSMVYNVQLRTFSFFAFSYFYAFVQCFILLLKNIFIKKELSQFLTYPFYFFILIS